MKKVIFLMIFLGFVLPGISQATCSRATGTGYLTTALIEAGYTATSWSGACDTCNGNIGLPSVVSLSTGSSFMPSGTLIASSTADFFQASVATTYGQNQILFRCALADADSIYEMYGTNGDNAYTGRYTTDEVDNAYYSPVRNVAYRLTNTTTGEYYSRYWKARKLTADDWVQDETYIYIPASIFSGITIELFKIDSTSYYTNSSTSWLMSYSQPYGYIAFKGPGLSTNVTDGADSYSNANGWYTAWPAAYGLYNDVTFVRGAMCLVKDYPSVVLLPTISTSSLNNGETSQSTFDISLTCEDAAVSSVSKSTTSSANVAMGFLVNQSTAVTAATTLGLTSTSGLTHLLDTNYGSSGVASGVGIRIYDESGNALNLLSSTTTATGNTGGWYAYKALTTSQDDSTDGVTTYTGNFTASLEAISGETVTAGTVNAQLQVVVSFQ
ncbi:fimbrial usher protein StbD [Rahnella sikkimica]|uniref:Fimbrial protein n=1 Tax=Rahnella sikkimica TaxID=1805933 RepID=A0A2L1UXI7_9GAMM|nr:fimbrial usher protein StbD [Rahnella sikkimica]AVF37627.1 fimbrial protein [Rahnella sikkimica]